MKSVLINIYEWFHQYIKRLRRRLMTPQIPINPDGKVYVNLGCGNDSGTEFINIDLLSYPKIHHLHDITDLSMFADHSVDLIYASHVVEHIPKEKLFAVLREWKRVLKRDGILRISVPDFGKLIELYQKNGEDVEMVRDQILGQKPPYDNHYTLWNFGQAKKIFEELGFSKIKTWNPETADHHDFKDRSSYPISLNVEVTKP